MRSIGIRDSDCQIILDKMKPYPFESSLSNFIKNRIRFREENYHTPGLSLPFVMFLRVVICLRNNMYLDSMHRKALFYNLNPAWLSSEIVLKEFHQLLTNYWACNDICQDVKNMILQQFENKEFQRIVSNCPEVKTNIFRDYKEFGLESFMKENLN